MALNFTCDMCGRGNRELIGLTFRFEKSGNSHAVRVVSLEDAKKHICFICLRGLVSISSDLKLDAKELVPNSNDQAGS